MTKLKPRVRTPGPIAERILDALMRYPCAYSMSDLVYEVYRGHEPEWPENSLYVVMRYLNTRWLPANLPWLTIVNRGRVIRLVLRKPTPGGLNVGWI